MTITRPPELSGALWPIHPKPLEDELLSSWMVRIARGFYINPCVFWRRVGGVASFRAIDCNPDAALLRLLAERTHTPVSRVMQTTLRRFDSLALLREGSYRNLVAFCPSCLADGTAYFRRSWCVNFVLVCGRHNAVLLDCCPRCRALVRPERIPLERASLASCRTCGFDLSGSPFRSAADATTATTLQQRLFRLLDEDLGSLAA